MLRNRIIVIGDLMLDVTARGIASRLAPEECVPVIHCDNMPTKSPGGAANVAINLYKTNTFEKVILIGAVGDDENGDHLLSQLQGLDLSNIVKVTNFRTTTKYRTFADSRMIARHDFESKFTGDFKLEHVSIDKNTIVFISDYDKGVIERAQTFLKRAHNLGALIICDPKNNINLYKYVNILKPNNFEMNKLNTGDHVMKMFIKLPFLKQIVLTKGCKGITLVNRDGTVSHSNNPIGTVATNVVGAGDTVAVMMCLLLKSKNIIEDAGILTATGAAAVSFDGVLQLDQNSVNFLQNKLSPTKLSCVDTKYLYTDDKIISLRESAKATKKRIVLCKIFDNLPDLILISRAKAFGEIVVVAFEPQNTNSMLSLETRLLYMCLLPVDYIIGFDNCKTINKLIQIIQPQHIFSDKTSRL
jgi:rfaE bifunctional protein kinase chain/domain